MGGCLEQVWGPWRPRVDGFWVVRTYRGRSHVAEGHHKGQRPPAREAGVPPAGTSVRRAQLAVYASIYKLIYSTVYKQEKEVHTYIYIVSKIYALLFIQ